MLRQKRAEDRARVVEAMAGRSAGQSLSIEYRWQYAGGQYKHFLDQAVLLLRDAFGNPVEFAGTLLDVTDRKELESQLTQARKMDAIGQLTGGIAHDFHNLLAAVLGGLGMIERRVSLDDDQARIIGMTRHAAEQGAELVKHLLAFARRQKLEPASIRIPRLAQSVTNLLAHTLGGMVELEWKLSDRLSPVYADAAQLELALMNLIINARDAMPDGGVVTVTAEDREIVEQVGRTGLAPGHYVVIGIGDTGCGIAPEMIEQVLEPFFTTKPGGQGDRARARHGIWLRAAIGRRSVRRQRAWPGHLRRDLAPARARCRCAKGAGRRGRRSAQRRLERDADPAGRRS